MFENTVFQKLVDAGRPTGEVVACDRFFVSVKGLGNVGIQAQVIFENGQRGMVQQVGEEVVLVMNLETEDTPLGSLVVLDGDQPTAQVGEGLIGRILSPLGKPLDGLGPVKVAGERPLYFAPPSITEREVLSQPLNSGVTVVDSLFTIVMGQRIAILGDIKSGKSSFIQQLGINQTGSDRVVVYVLIGKRRVEIDQLVSNLNATGAIKNSIVIVANMFDSLAQSYIAPYVGCAIAEHLWLNGRDVVIVYDDLTSHAKIYREVALLSGASPGRDSYPGDMFFAHSSLLERAGKLKSNGKTLTALPVVLTPNDDVTAFLPTSIMSITDGQIIFDLASFRQNIRPAVNIGLSVSRVGGRAQTDRQKLLALNLFKSMSTYRQAAEFAHFGSEMSPDTQRALRLGEMLQEAFRQPSSELYSPIEQQLILQTVLASAGKLKLNVGLLKLQARKLAPNIQKDADIDSLVPQLLNAVIIPEQK